MIHEPHPVADRMNLQAWVAKPRKLRGAVEVFARLAAWSQVQTAGWRGAERERLAAFSALYDAGAFEALG